MWKINFSGKLKIYIDSNYLKRKVKEIIYKKTEDECLNPTLSCGFLKQPSLCHIPIAPDRDV